MDEPFKSTHHFIALCPSLDRCIQGYGVCRQRGRTPLLSRYL